MTTPFLSARPAHQLALRATPNLGVHASLNAVIRREIGGQHQ
jgi:hypothetical protein